MVEHVIVDEDVGLDINELRSAIQGEYESVALNPELGFHFHIGRQLAQMLDYKSEWLEDIPESAIESFAGTGNPFSLGSIQPGERVVDVGCGAGSDSLIAARMVGPKGSVVGVDMTPAMIKKAQKAANQAHLENVSFRQGYGEDLPIADEWADVVISNGVLNLMPDKMAGLQEMARVLKPSGRLQIGDILVQKEVPESAKRDIDLWAGWIAGGLLEAELQMTVVMAGFVDFEITMRKDIYSGAPQEGSAVNYDTIGITFRARKPATQAEWHAALKALNCEIPED